MPSLEVRYLPGDRVSVPDWDRAGVVRAIMYDAQSRTLYLVHGDALPGDERYGFQPCDWLADVYLVPLVLSGRELVP